MRLAEMRRLGQATLRVLADSERTEEIHVAEERLWEEPLEKVRSRYGVRPVKNAAGGRIQ